MACTLELCLTGRPSCCRTFPLNGIHDVRRACCSRKDLRKSLGDWLLLGKCALYITTVARAFGSERRPDMKEAAMRLDVCGFQSGNRGPAGSSFLLVFDYILPRVPEHPAEAAAGVAVVVGLLPLAKAATVTPKSSLRHWPPSNLVFNLNEGLAYSPQSPQESTPAHIF